MARNDGRIEKGQSLRTAISAKAWNRAQEAADRVLGAQPGTAGEGVTVSGGASNIVYIKNNSGQDVPWLGVLRISGVAIDPSGGTLTGNADADKRARQFATQPVLAGQSPDRNNDNIAIAMEPIENGKIGRAAVGGCFACKVRVLSSSHGFAKAKHGDPTQLESAGCGPIQLLWKEAGEGPMKWAAGVM